MTEVEKGSDQRLEEKREAEGVSVETLMFMVDADRVAKEREEDLLTQVAITGGGVPEPGEQHPITDEAPPADGRPEFNELPD